MGIYTPAESVADLNLERNFIAGDLICGLGYGECGCSVASGYLIDDICYVLGIQLCLYAYCAAYLWKQRNVRRHAYFILAYISVIFVVETVFVAVQARTVQICYIDNRVSIPIRCPYYKCLWVRLCGIELPRWTLAIFPGDTEPSGERHVLCDIISHHVPM